MNAPQCYVIRTLPVLFSLSLFRSVYKCDLRFLRQYKDYSLLGFGTAYFDKVAALPSAFFYFPFSLIYLFTHSFYLRLFLSLSYLYISLPPSIFRVSVPSSFPFCLDLIHLLQFFRTPHSVPWKSHASDILRTESFRSYGSSRSINSKRQFIPISIECLRKGIVILHRSVTDIDSVC